MTVNNLKGHSNVYNFWATVCKTVRPVLWDRCLSVLSVCDVGVLWPNGWMDQDETWYAAPLPKGREVGLGPGDTVLYGNPAPAPPKKGTAPQFSVHICCGQTAGWIKMSLDTKVDLGPGHIVLDGDPALPPKRRSPPPEFSAHVCAQTVTHLNHCWVLSTCNNCEIVVYVTLTWVSTK